MSGGIVQIAVYGSQDLFLTGTPQITFFKTVYRRHTNFAIESIRQDFLGDSDFGKEVSCVVDKLGDLLSKCYLEIILPKIELTKNPAYWNNTLESATVQKDSVQAYYEVLYNYVSQDTSLTKQLKSWCSTNNITMDTITALMSDPLIITPLVNSRNDLITFINDNPVFDLISNYDKNKYILTQEINQMDIKKLFDNVIYEVDNFYPLLTTEQKDSMKRSMVLNIINNLLYTAIKRFYEPVYELLVSANNIYNQIINGTYAEYYNFAWVEEIGHSIINTLDFKLGSQPIDRHTGDWMIIYNKLFKSAYQEKNYDKMIGNVPELTVYDDKIKNQYKLVVPLRLFFCRFNGLALPLVSLRYSEVLLTLKYKILSDLCYVENSNEYNGIDNLQSKYGINIVSATLYADYVFLDSDERRRFAQASHEYLVEITQYTEIPDINTQDYNIQLSFANPTKYVCWFAQLETRRQNLTGSNKCQWNNYAVNDDQQGYTMEYSYIILNNENLTSKTFNMTYYNYVQPYQYFIHTPTDGLNTYSFAIMPTEQQPSGTCNMTRISSFNINTRFTNEYIITANNNVSGIYIGVYVVSYSILRIVSGMGALAFQTSS
jgi:hypothetical protein